jgi:hypothetical protein
VTYLVTLAVGFLSIFQYTWVATYTSFVVAIAFFALLVLRRESLCWCLLISSIIIFDDFALDFSDPPSTIHNIQLLGVSIVEFMCVCLLLSHNKLMRLRQMPPATLLLVAPFFIGIFSSFFFQDNPLVDKWMLRYILIIGFSCLFVGIFSAPNRTQFFERLIYFVCISLAVKSILVIFSVLAGFGAEVAGGAGVRGAPDSSKNLMHIPIVLLVYYKANGLRSPKWLVAAATLCFLSILLYSSRGMLMMLVLALAFVQFSTLYRRRRGRDILRAIATIASLLVGTGIAFIVLYSFFPGMFTFFQWKIGSVAFQLYDGGSTAARVLELINIYYQHLEQQSLLLGSGWGSWFTDSAFPYIDSYWRSGSAYPQVVFETGKIYNPHGIFLVLFLKTGLIGLLSYMLLIYKLFRGAVSKNSRLPIYTIFVAGSLIPIFYKLGSLTTIFFFAVLLGFFFALSGRTRVE